MSHVFSALRISTKNLRKLLGETLGIPKNPYYV
jgi:hypothetical protein